MRSPATNSSWLNILGSGCSIASDTYAQQLGLDDYLPDASILPPMVRRRTSLCTKLAVSALHKACISAGVEYQFPVVFVSSVGESQVMDKLCHAIANNQYPLSPTQFHNSVHNTAAGYWSIATKSMHAMTSIGALKDGLALGLIEVWSQLSCGSEKVLLVVYDESQPKDLVPDYQWEPAAFAFLLALTPGPLTPGQAKISLPESAPANNKEDVGQFADTNPAVMAMDIYSFLHSGVSGTKTIYIPGELCSWTSVIEIDDQA